MHDVGWCKSPWAFLTPVKAIRVAVNKNTVSPCKSVTLFVISNWHQGIFKSILPTKVFFVRNKRGLDVLLLRLLCQCLNDNCNWSIWRIIVCAQSRSSNFWLTDWCQANQAKFYFPKLVIITVLITHFLFSYLETDLMAWRGLWSKYGLINKSKRPF